MLASFYDPMGLLCAHIITLKIMMRELCQYEEPGSANGGGDAQECRLGWDDRLTTGLETKWKKATKELVMAESVRFPRGIKPANAIGRPEVIAFWDGSMQAFATTVYIRWKVKEDPPAWCTGLLTAKARVAPIKGISAVCS